MGLYCGRRGENCEKAMAAFPKMLKELDLFLLEFFFPIGFEF